MDGDDDQAGPRKKGEWMDASTLESRLQAERGETGSQMDELKKLVRQEDTPPPPPTHTLYLQACPKMLQGNDACAGSPRQEEVAVLVPHAFARALVTLLPALPCPALRNLLSPSRPPCLPTPPPSRPPDPPRSAPSARAG